MVKGRTPMALSATWAWIALGVTAIVIAIVEPGKQEYAVWRDANRRAERLKQNQPRIQRPHHEHQV
jgi:hypothetical protein